VSGELTKKIQDIMTAEMGQIGVFIVSKQCRDLGIDPENIAPEDLNDLAKALGKVMLTFGGSEKAKKIEQQIKKLARAGL